MTSDVQTVQPFDLAQFQARDTAVLEVLNQRGAPLLYNGQQVTIEVYGPGTREYLGAQHRMAQSNQANAFAAMRGKPAKETVEGNIKKNADRLADCTKSVNNFPVSSIDLYSDPKLGYITKQVAEFLDDWSNF